MTEDKSKLTTMTGLLKQQIAAYDKQVKPLKAQNRELNDKITVIQVQLFVFKFAINGSNEPLFPKKDF